MRRTGAVAASAVLVLWCCFLCRGGDGFNLETRLPIIKVGNRGAYFGYSVAQHQSLNDGNNGIESNW